MEEEILNYEDEKVLTEIPKNKKGVALYSGGKDSGLALSIACESAEIVALINCCEQKHPMFHQHDTDLMELQSQSLKIPIVYSNGHWKESTEIEGLLKKYKSQRVEFVVFGDICSIKNANRKIKLCKDVGLIPCMPLWNKTYDWLFEEMKKRNLKCLLSSVRPQIKDFVGKILDDEIYEKFKKMEINSFGEMGEFHSTLLDLDIFEFPIKYEIKSVYKCEDKFGEKWEINAKYSK